MQSKNKKPASPFQGKRGLRIFVREVLKEEFFAAYNDYRASRDPVQKHLRSVSVEDVNIRNSKFVSLVRDLLYEEGTPEEFANVKWFFMHMGILNDIPCAVLPTGETRIVYWDEAIQGLRANDDLEVLDAMKAFAERPTTMI